MLRWDSRDLRRRATCTAALLCLPLAVSAGAPAKGKESKLPGYKAAQIYPVGAAPAALAHADFDGDGLTDVAAGGSKGISILRGTGRGLLSKAKLVPLARGAQELAAITLPGDSNPDLVATSAGALVTLTGDGDAGFQAAGSLPLSAGRLGGLAAADLDDDGVTDLAVSRPAETDIAILRGLPVPSFTPATTLPSPGASVSFGEVVAAPLNSDPYPDVIATRSDGSLSSWLGGAGLTFGNPVPTFVGSELTGVATGDVNGDGRADAIASRALGTEDQLIVLRGNGEGALRPEAPKKVGRKPAGIAAVAAADLTGDGRDDLLAGYAQKARVTLIETKASGKLGKPARVAVKGRSTPVVEAAHLDPGSRADVIVLAPKGRNGGKLSAMLGKK
jgi:hypothetical protein